MWIRKIIFGLIFLILIAFILKLARGDVSKDKD